MQLHALLTFISQFNTMLRSKRRVYLKNPQECHWQSAEAPDECYVFTRVTFLMWRASGGRRRSASGPPSIIYSARAHTRPRAMSHHVCHIYRAPLSLASVWVFSGAGVPFDSCIYNTVQRTSQEKQWVSVGAHTPLAVAHPRSAFTPSSTVQAH